jgi:hypothetical protein
MADAIKTALAQPRVSYSTLKSLGVTSLLKTLEKKEYLLEICKKIASVDLPPNVPESEMMRIYGIKGDNHDDDYDPRVALGILLDKGGTNVYTLAYEVLRQTLLPVSTIQQTATLHNSPEISVPATETKAEAEYSVPILEPSIEGSKNRSNHETKHDEIFFPRTNTSKSCESITKFLVSNLSNNIDDLKRDGLISVNDLIDATGLTAKEFRLDNWAKTDGSEEFIRATMRRTGKQRDEVYKTVRGKNAGTWVNMYIAFDIARWFCSDFGIMVYDIVMRVMRGDLGLVPEVVNRHDELNNTLTNLSTSAPAGPDQVRQTTVISVEIDTASQAQLDMQQRINASQAAFNHKLMRAIDYSNPIPKSILYKRDQETGTLMIKKDCVGKTDVERALVTLYPEIFSGDNVTSMHDLIEEMWFKIVYLENALAKLANANESKADDATINTVLEQRTIIKQLRTHIDHLTTIHRLKPLIDSLAKPRPKRAPGSYDPPPSDEPNIHLIHQLLDEVFSGARIQQGTIDQLNWHMTSKLGCEFKSHIDLKHLIAVVTDMTDILRADLTTRDFNPVVPKIFGDIFADADRQLQAERSPVYYRNLLDDITSMQFETAGNDSSYEDTYSETESTISTTATRRSSESIDSGDAYQSVSIHIPKPKRSSAPSRSRVARRAPELGDELRTVITKALEDRANLTHPAVLKSRDEQILNIYIGQEGYAFHIIPRATGSTPRITLVVSLGDILEVGAFHLRPAGQISLVPGVTSAKALEKLANSNIPDTSKIGPAIFTITREYPAMEKSPVTTMLKIIVTTIGAQHITSITYPSDPLGQSWNIVTSREL